MPDRGSAGRSVQTSDSEDRFTQPSRGAKLFLLVLLLGVLTAGAMLIVRSDDPTDVRSQTPVVERGVACPHLGEAALKLELGDREGFALSVRRAARVALESLDNSQEVFGVPERAAIELDALLEDSSPGFLQWLEKASRVCETLDRWPASLAVS
jgi:hypothetical protein